MEQFNVILTTLTTLLFLGFFVAGLGMVFQFFMTPNMIFYPWAVLLMKIARKGEIWRHLMRPLGRCRYCNSTWIAIYVYKSRYFFGSLDLRVLVLIAATWIWLKLFSDYIFRHIEPNEKVEAIYGLHDLPPTPAVPMLKAYMILAVFYSMIYIVIPLVSDKIPVLLANK